MKKMILRLIVFILCANFANAQFGFSHEIGAITGPVAFQSDYGERHDFDTNKGNTGIGIGIVHYINFSYRADCNCYTSDTFFNDHFKLRSELSWNLTKLDHFGEWVKPERQTITAEFLRTTKGEAQVFDLGMQLEYFPLSIRDFAAGGYSFAPFVSIGAHYNSFSPDLQRSDVLLTPQIIASHPIWNYQDSYSTETDSTWSVVWSVGTRYKLTPLSDLMLDLRWQYYFSDWVDGLDHNAPSDKYNDWNVWLNFGYIYYLD